MAADCAVELKKSNVSMVSLWPGAVKTEYIREKTSENKIIPPPHFFWNPFNYFLESINVYFVLKRKPEK